ncbi:MAG: carbon-nitrogen hydrolase family protein [Chloroflexi bacterium]|nr:carbon-nitrogen hydrolase family protein [Chloroflexota bacterium]
MKIAGVQMNPEIMANRKNLDKILKETRLAAARGADLVVFPECALPGYVYASREEAMPYMETIPGPSTEKIAVCCRELGVHVVFGLLEKDGAQCFNAAVLVGPQGLVGKYRKNHLPFLGIDRFVDHGNEPFQVYSTPIGNLGLHICYDTNFPECARIMTLMGADILVLPTNWPDGRGMIARYVINSRAFENKVHFVAVDRVGTERGAKFLGNSKIVDCWGNTLAEAGKEDEEVIYGEVNLAEARQKKMVFKPGEFEMDFIEDRHPQLYGQITAAKKVKSRAK